MAPLPDPRPLPSARRLIGRLARARGGNVAILFGLLSLPMLAFTGVAIDYGFATRLETKLQAATDATALLLCQTPLNTTSATLNTTAKTAMIGQMGSAGLVVDPLTITSNPRQIKLTTHKLQTAFFGRITGTASLNPAAMSRCATPLPKTFEIALVLDNTGSMSASSGGQSKLQAVQKAATDFVNWVFKNPAFSSQTKIAIVPFAATVAVDPSTYRYASWIDQQGKSTYHWTNVLSPGASGFTSRFDVFNALQSAYSGWGWAGCLESLPYPLNVQDGAPTTGNRDSYYLPMFAPDEPGGGNTSYAGYTVGQNTYYSFNSYIDDASNSATCAALPGGTSFNAAEGRACKYVNARNAAPTSSNYLGIPNGPNSGCTTKPLQRLTNDAAVLRSLIAGMAPQGSTNIHEGLMWGWRTLSPNSVFADGAPYAPNASSSNDNVVNKVIILMTDGTNTWTQNPYAPNGSLYGASAYFQNANGTSANPRMPSSNQNVSDNNSARAALDALTAQACTNAKAPNISVYTIGFSVPSDPIDAAGQSLLKNCASSADQYRLANTSDDLIKAFQDIQASIGTLRFTQ